MGKPTGESSEEPSKAVEPPAEQPSMEEPAETGGVQPLTRPECEGAGMTWNENANVCDAG